MYLDAVKRCRWSFVTIGLLASVLLLHLYVRDHGSHSAQLAETLKRRLINDTENKLRADKARFKELHGKIHFHKEILKKGSDLERQAAQVAIAASEEELKKFDDIGTREFRVMETTNTLQKAALENQKLPLLGLMIPLNDFATVLGVLLAFFCCVTWISVRAVHVAVCTLDLSTMQMRKLVQACEVFSEFNEPGRPGRATRAFRALVFILPIAAIVFASCMDVWLWMFDQNTLAVYGASNAWVWRCGVWLGSMVGVVVFMILSLMETNGIDRTLRG